MDRDQEAISHEDTRNPAGGATGDNLAYIIYTSGSMGMPKGVMITHANLYHCARDMGETLCINATDRYLHTASFGFSSSVRQFSVPLACGAALIMAPSDCIRDPLALFGLIHEKRVSVIDFVPSFWRVCLQELHRLDPVKCESILDNNLRLVLSASEYLASDIAKDCLEMLGENVRMVNMYGQTETTGIVTTCEILNAASITGPGTPIGRAIPNIRIYLLDRAGKPVPVGTPGEVYVSGAGVGSGYLNLPDLTSERFIQDPFSPGRQMYRSGDLARHRSDGMLEFISRTDDQIKIRGHRIEPGEIEDLLNQHPGVQESVLLAESVNDQKRLVAYVAPFPGAAERNEFVKELRSLLKHKLPDYMVPNIIEVLDQLPRTVTGKIDRKALLVHCISDGTVSRDKSELPAGFVPPRTAIEKKLAEIWCKHLRVERVGTDDNFFDLGGDSLLSLRIIRHANEAGLRINLKQLFKHQTLGELARIVTQTQDVTDEPEPQPRPQPIKAQLQPDNDEMMIYVTLESLRAYGREALEKAGLKSEGAEIVTEVQLEASLRGQPTHNMDSIPRYARQLLAGAINGKPCIRIENETKVSVQIDGDNGPGQWVATIAMETAIGKALKSGIGVSCVRRSNHFGAAGHYVWLAARRGLIGLCTTNGPLILSPTGGVTPTFGNNPLAAGIPAERHHPIILDIAMSVAPRGKIGLQLAEGKPLQPGWILDRFGRPSLDPSDLAAGLGVPIGGHKGYGLAIVMEALAGALPGAGFCWDHRRERMKDASKPRDIGHFFIVINPELFSSATEFFQRVDRLIEQTKSAKPMENVSEVLIPGESELRAREMNLKKGVPLRPVTYRSLTKYSDKARLSSHLVTIKNT